jgi:cytochrome bd-type quinol oxidase subunit 2
MFPRTRRPHDQLLRATVVAAVGGLIVGHILWLIATSMAIATSEVEHWMLIISAVILAASAASFYVGWRHYRRASYVWAAFLLCLPISPVFLTLGMLGVMYL